MSVCKQTHTPKLPGRRLSDSSAEFLKREVSEDLLFVGEQRGKEEDELGATENRGGEGQCGLVFEGFCSRRKKERGVHT